MSVCRSCGEAGVETFFSLPAVPTSSCVLVTDPGEAKAWPRRPLVLGACPACGFIENEAFDPSAVDYTAPYEESQAASPVFRAFAERTVDRLVSRYGLAGKTVLEIGCGKGEWLGLCCERGNMTGVGFDPAYVPGRVPARQAGLFRVVPAFFDETRSETADLVVCRHTLEHIPDVDRFAGLLAGAVRRTPGAVLFVEVPDTSRVLREGAFWDVYYEHCSYFTATSLAGLLRRHGLAVHELRLDYDGQYLLAEAGVGDGSPAGGVDLAPARSFGERARARIGEWNRTLAPRESVVLWGAGSKAVGFLAAVDAAVGAVVDINPAKQGSYLPGTGVEVVAPEHLRRQPPDVVVVMNPVYRGEIESMLAELGVAPEVLVLE